MKMLQMLRMRRLSARRLKRPRARKLKRKLQLEKRLLGKLRKYLEEELGAAVDIDALSRD